jgi:hypothetical protein
MALAIIVIGLPALTIIGFAAVLFYKFVKLGNRLHNKTQTWLNK